MVFEVEKNRSKQWGAKRPEDFRLLQMLVGISKEFEGNMVPNEDQLGLMGRSLRNPPKPTVEPPPEPEPGDEYDQYYGQQEQQYNQHKSGRGGGNDTRPQKASNRRGHQGYAQQERGGGEQWPQSGSGEIHHTLLELQNGAADTQDVPVPIMQSVGRGNPTFKKKGVVLAPRGRLNAWGGG